MSTYTNPAEVAKIKAACRAAAEVLNDCRMFIVLSEPGTFSTKDIDDYAGESMAKHGCQSACLGYASYKRGVQPYPSQICISLNDEIVHGIASTKRIIQEGDIVSLDVVVAKDGYIGDNAYTVAVGKIKPEAANLLKVTEESLYKGIEQAVRGNRVGDIGAAVQTHVEAAGFSVVRDFVGHGVGRTMHEDPQVPNFGKKGTGEPLKVGTVIAIEPMINMGSVGIKIDPDGWTARTADGLPSAHFEHTILITSKGPQILTKI